MTEKILRPGITTGASAAAAAQAAVILLFTGRVVAAGQVTNPQGKLLQVPVQEAVLRDGQARAVVIKDGGDDPDVTHGLPIVVTAAARRDGIEITGGQGVGRVTKPGLQVPVGEPAINPVPRKMIEEAVRPYLPEGAGVRLEVSVPGGLDAARRTLNSKLGIEGGISILGTTGIVEPMSEEALKNSLVPQISIAVALGQRTLCLVPGRLGEKWMTEQFELPPEAVVQMSNFVGFMLNGCVARGVRDVILAGHHSKLTKVAAGCFHTHNKVADARLETLAALAGVRGAPPGVIGSLLEANTSEGALEILEANHLMGVLEDIAARAARRAMDHVFGQLRVGVIMFTMRGEVLAVDANARAIGREMNWPI